ncbi:MAG TPA: hypothetical protein DDZ88_21175 [Verrucomicrobiales bacterium]|nr:hypothetical protein [Verrucomicrobiales bacterium]
MNDTEFNPYAPPQAARLIPDSTPEAIRRAHIGHETSVKSIGGLYALVGGLMLLPVFIGLLESLTRASWRNDLTELVMMLLIGAGMLLLGAGVRRVRPWARIAMAVVSGLLAAVTLLTVIFPLLNLYVLWLMLSAKGRMVFSPAYQQIIAFTPDVRPRTSGFVWFLLCVVILFVIAVTAALLIPVFNR